MKTDGTVVGWHGSCLRSAIVPLAPVAGHLCCLHPAVCILRVQANPCLWAAAVLAPVCPRHHAGILAPKPFGDLWQEALHVQDADSLDKAGRKTEGAYYVWTAQEVDEVLGADTERERAFKQHYYVKANGNVDLSARR